MSRIKKQPKKLIELNQVDGKNEKFMPSTIAQIFGESGLSKYKTLDETIYTKEIKSMNLSDLRNHAIKIGLMPNKERERLEKQLLIEFRKHVHLFQKPDAIFDPKKMSAEERKTALDILSAVK